MRKEFRRERRLNAASFYRHSTVRAISRLATLDGDEVASLDRELAHMWHAGVRERAVAQASPTAADVAAATHEDAATTTSVVHDHPNSRGSKRGSVRNTRERPSSRGRNRSGGSGAVDDENADASTRVVYSDPSLARNPLLLEYRAQAAAALPFGDRYDGGGSPGEDAGGGSDVHLGSRGRGSDSSPYLQRHRIIADAGEADAEGSEQQLQMKTRRTKKKKKKKKKTSTTMATATTVSAGATSRRSKRSFVGRLRAARAAAEEPSLHASSTKGLSSSKKDTEFGARSAATLVASSSSSTAAMTPRTSVVAAPVVTAATTSSFCSLSPGGNGFDESIEVETDSESGESESDCGGSDDENGFIRCDGGAGVIAYDVKAASLQSRFDDTVATGRGGGAVHGATSPRSTASARSNPHAMMEQLLETVDLLRRERVDLLAQLDEATVENAGRFSSSRRRSRSGSTRNITRDVSGADAGWNARSSAIMMTGDDDVEDDDDEPQWMSRAELLAENTMLRHENANMFSVQYRNTEYREEVKSLSRELSDCKAALRRYQPRSRSSSSRPSSRDHQHLVSRGSSERGSSRGGESRGESRDNANHETSRGLLRSATNSTRPDSGASARSNVSSRGSSDSGGGARSGSRGGSSLRALPLLRPSSGGDIDALLAGILADSGHDDDGDNDDDDAGRRASPRRLEGRGSSSSSSSSNLVGNGKRPASASPSVDRYIAAAVKSISTPMGTSHSVYGAQFDDELAHLDGAGAAARAEALLGATCGDADAELAALFKRSQASLHALRSDVERFKSEQPGVAEEEGDGRASSAEESDEAEEEEEAEAGEEEEAEVGDAGELDGYIPSTSRSRGGVRDGGCLSLDAAAQRKWSEWEKEMCS